MKDSCARGRIIKAVIVLSATLSTTFGQNEHSFRPEIPRLWDEAAMSAMELPRVGLTRLPKHVTSEYYYTIPARTIYRTYPIYHPSREPEGYLEWLKNQEPQIAFDPSKLTTREDWIQAGETVFSAPISYLPLTAAHNVNWFEQTFPLTRDGTMPFRSYVIRTKGVVELTELSCAMCHTRVMPDGTVIKGAQGNFRINAFGRARPRMDTWALYERMFAAPWLGADDPMRQFDPLDEVQLVTTRQVIPAGVNARHGTSPFAPSQIPDLTGVKDRAYLDHTGLIRHRSIADFMRYAAMVQGTDYLSAYDGFVPQGKDPAAQALGRYSDEQLYALALFIYSLQPPANPNKLDTLALRGQKVFNREGCHSCHTPPLYTNNKLTPVEGFKIPAPHKAKYDVLPVTVGTDSALALKTRMATGYYKVPSLKGVWYRGPFEHSGSVARLEDWFDANRLRDDYVPTGFKGYGVETRAVPGHRFGLQLSLEDRQALIAFLKTL
jgi:hypothetical protein